MSNNSFFANLEKSTILVLIMVSFFYFSIYYFFSIKDLHHMFIVDQKEPWIYGHWAITYAGGLIRRGLIGSIVLPIVGEESYVETISVILTYAYLSFFLLSASVLLWARSNNIFWYLVLIFHPFGIFYSIAEPYGVGRGEIFYFISLFSLLITYRFFKSYYGFIVYSVLASITVFIHEPFIFVLGPLFVAIIYLILNKGVNIWVGLTSFLIPILFFIFLSLFFSKPIAIPICEGLGTAAPDKCTELGQVYYIQQGIGYALNNAYHTVKNIGYIEVNSVGILLIITMPVLYLLFCKNNPIKRAFSLLILVSTLLALPIFIFSNDWGRYQRMLFITIVAAFLLMDLCDGRNNPISMKKILSDKLLPLGKQNIIYLLFCLFFVGAVTVPANGARILPGPWIKMLEDFEFTTLAFVDNLRCSVMVKKQLAKTNNEPDNLSLVDGKFCPPTLTVERSYPRVKQFVLFLTK